jgi:hypothetical protein
VAATSRNVHNLISRRDQACICLSKNGIKTGLHLNLSHWGRALEAAMKQQPDGGFFQRSWVLFYTASSNQANDRLALPPLVPS